MTPSVIYNGWLALDHALVEGQIFLATAGRVEAIGSDLAIPPGYQRLHLRGDIHTPGFVYLQLKGGGGALFNDAPTIETIQLIAKSHARYATTALLPT